MIATLLTLAAAAQNYDAVTAAPTSHRVLLEDEKVRVLHVEIAPGATEPMHEHRWPSIMYFEQPQPIAYVTYRLEGDWPVVVERVKAPRCRKV